MKRYKCIKEVLAEPMNSKEAGDKGLIRDYKPGNRVVEGFHVIYEDGYESWSPKAAFLAGYKEKGAENE